MPTGSEESDAVAVLRRWEDSGGIWRVVSRTTAGLSVSLRTCTAGEEVDRLVSADPALLAYVGDRTASDQ